MTTNQESRTTGTISQAQESRTSGTIAQGQSVRDGSDILGHAQNTIGAPVGTSTPLHFTFGWHSTLGAFVSQEPRSDTQLHETPATSQETRTIGTA